MSLKENFVVKSGIDREYSELDVKRFDYLVEHPRNYLGDEIVCDGVELSDIFESEKTSSKGNNYISRFGKLVFYQDDDEIALSYGFNLWKPVKDGVITIKSNNPLSKLIQVIINNERNNRFDVKYAELQEIISTIDTITIVPKIINTRNGFDDYGFEVINIKWEGE